MTASTPTVDASTRAAAIVSDRASARAFVDAVVAPAAGEFDATGALPRSFLGEVAAAGAFGIATPLAYGGGGADMVTVGAVHEEFGRGCSSLRSLLTVHTMVAWAIARWGSDTQRESWLQSLARGEAFASFCLSEAEAGSDTRAVATTASPAGAGWVISGRKRWITGGMTADLFLTFARTPDGHVSGFLVPRSQRTTVTPIPDMLGTRASMVSEVEFDEVSVGADSRLGGSALVPGLMMTSALDIGRYSVACGSVGIVAGCLEASVVYARSRRVGGVLLADLPLIQSKIADMVTALQAGRALCERAGRLKDAGDPASVMATWTAKYFASTAAVRSSSDAVQVHGAHGCRDGHPVARYYRDAKIMEIIEGSSELQQLNIGAAALGTVQA